MRSGLAIGFLVSLGLVRPGQAQDNLLMMGTTISADADRWYQTHYADSVRSAFEEVLVHVYSDPDPSSEVKGTLFTVARYEPYLHFAWIYRSSDDDSMSVWREDVGDWGYGILQFVVDTTNGMVRLPPGPYGEIGWSRLAVDDSGDGFNGDVRSIEGQLVQVEAIRVIETISGGPKVVSGVMFIVSIDSGIVTMRPEVHADMPCGEDVTGPADTEVPTYQSRVCDFVTDDLHPRFSVAYPKGC